jgi:hypothetical protein
MYARIALSSLFLIACLNDSAEVAAHPRGPNATYSVSVEDENGRELRTFHHRGQTFVLGAYGERYVVRVENRTGRRVEAVVTVDGRDVISGRKGDFVNERGYLIDPYGEVVIEGFRQSLDEVAAFRFTIPEGSYSSRMGTPENVGVIGVAVFPERERVIARRYQPPPRDIARPQAPARRPSSSREDSLRNSYRGGAAGPTPSQSGRLRGDENMYGGSPSRDKSEGKASSGLDTRGAAPEPAAPSSRAEAYAEERSRRYDYDAPRGSVDNLGTEYGESMYSSVREIPFERANARQPASLITLRYDDRAGLIARGILYERPYAMRPQGPQAFPESRFAPPPPY